MSKVPSPAELRNTKQPYPTDMLVRWAEESGFETRRSNHGSSHITCRHTKYKDIHFGIVVNSKSLGSQRCFSDSLLKIEKRDAEALATITMQAFNQAEQNIRDNYKNLPTHFVAEHDFEKGHTVLRDKQLPQLGVTIPFAEARLAENKMRYMESIKREAFILLNRAKMEYDVEIGLVKGKFGGQLSHAIYDIEPKVIPPYQAGEKSGSILEDINDFIMKVSEKDEVHDSKLDSLLANDFVGAAKIAYSSRRGERTNAVRLERPDGGSFTLKFETASNRRAEIGDIHRGRIAEAELARVEKTICALANAYHKTEQMALRVA